jgi:hypothetical protein
VTYNFVQGAIAKRRQNPPASAFKRLLARSHLLYPGELSIKTDIEFFASRLHRR